MTHTKPRLVSAVLVLALLLLPGVTAGAELRAEDGSPYCYFETPEDLAELCRQETIQQPSAFQSWEDDGTPVEERDFVLREDLTIPGGLSVYLSSRLVIPRGITVTVSKDAELHLCHLRIDGKLVNRGTVGQSARTDEENRFTDPVLEGDGSVENEGFLFLLNPDDPDFPSGHVTGSGTVLWENARSYVLGRDISLEDALWMAEDEPGMELNLYGYDDVVLTGDVTFPANVSLFLEDGTLVIPKDSRLVSHGYIALTGVMQVDGSLENNGILSLSESGHLFFAHDDGYEGEGSVFVEAGMDFPMTGVDEARFQYDGAVHCYRLRPASGKTEQSVPTPAPGAKARSAALRWWSRLRMAAMRLYYRLGAKVYIIIALAVLLLLGLGLARKKNRPVPERSARADSPAPVWNGDPLDYDSAAADRERRLRELDGWLKSGVIDRGEYKVMKQRILGDGRR